MTNYWINTIDSDEWPAWAALCVSVVPGAQSGGNCAYHARTEQAEALEAALDADDSVIAYTTEE